MRANILSNASRVRCTHGKIYQFDNEEKPLHMLLQNDTEEALDQSILESIRRLDDEANRLMQSQLACGTLELWRAVA
jgi:hypothetical protein